MGSSARPVAGLRRLARPRTRPAEDQGARNAPRLERRGPPAPDERPARRPPRPGRFHGRRPRARSARAGAVEDDALRPLPRRRPDRLAGPVELPPARTGRRVHQGGVIPTSITSCARAASWPCRAGSRSRIVRSSSSSGDKAWQFSAWYSHDGRRWVELGRVDATFTERVEVGVVAVNSSERDAVGRTGEVERRGPPGFDGSGLSGPRPEGPSRPRRHREKFHGFFRARPRAPSTGPRRKSP